MVNISDGANYAPSAKAEQVVAPGEFCFAVAHLDHCHIYGLRDAGATLEYVYDPDPAWFFDKSRYGGILTDIGSHQVEQFLTYADCADAAINFARVANFSHPDRPGLEDFGETSMTGDNGASFYSRVDWYTPDGLRTWGDGRTFIIGSTGSLELRKYIDVARAAPTAKLFLVDSEQEREIDCLGRSGFPFFGRLIRDCIERTETAMTQDHVFKAAQLSMQAQKLAEELAEQSAEKSVEQHSMEKT